MLITELGFHSVQNCGTSMLSYNALLKWSCFKSDLRRMFDNTNHIILKHNKNVVTGLRAQDH